MLSEYDRYKVLRPIIGQEKQSIYKMPTIKKEDYSKIDLDQLKIIDASKINDQCKNTLALMFNYDKILEKYWNNPLKYLAKFQLCGAVSTPDFSVYPRMSMFDVMHNVYKNRWLGVTWQNAGNTIIPSVAWGEEHTYDVCFSGIEEGCIVVISTLGCQNKKKEFLEGFFEMKKRIKPPLIIVYGNMIEGMTGRFINYKYEDIFVTQKRKKDNVKLSKIFEIKEESNYGK